MTPARRMGIAAAAVFIVLAAAIAFAWPRRPVVTVRMGTARYADYLSTLPAVGTIEHSDTRTIAALQSGNLENIAVHPGQRVQRGELLATISNPQLLSAEESAHAMYLVAAARAASARQKARENLASSQLALDQAQRNLLEGAEGTQGSAAEQRSIAAAAVARAQTEAREADRIARANRDLYAQKAISRDALDQSEVRASEARVALLRAQQAAAEVATDIARNAPLLREQVRAAELALALARSHEDVDAARDEASARYSDWMYAHDRAAGLQIHAPFDGIVQTIANVPGDAVRPLRPGDPVEIGTVLLTLATSNALIVRTTIDEQDVGKVSVGQRVRVSGEDFRGRVGFGRVAAIGAVAQKSTDSANPSRQVVTIVRLDGSPAFVRAGMSADVEIITSVQPRALVVDPAAIRRDANGRPYVFVVRGGIAAKTPVEVGPMNETQAVIRSGIGDGDVVVTDRTAAVVDGTKVVALSS
ncbi:MAG TPA: efflux RND transporter periplasmic adaptor subunit [Candidatus Acidoferrales bacterium]|nr:efflux RND transporter periplasmic adaptor subunit [Candidatus Acidoferrales bacterium]